MWNPDHRVHYKGKYPVLELVKARSALIYALKDSQSEVLERLKPRIGIPSRYGPPVPFFPPVQPPTQQIGRGDNETFFSSEDEVVLKKRRLSKKESTPTSTVVREEPHVLHKEPSAVQREAPLTVSFAESPTTLSEGSRTGVRTEAPLIERTAATTESRAAQTEESRIEEPDQKEELSQSSEKSPNRVRADSRNSERSLDDSSSVIEMLLPSPEKTVVDLTEDEETQHATDVTNSFSIGDEHNDVTVTEELIEIFKCDFCEFKTKDTRNYDEIEAHLESAKHYTASRYKARKCEEGDESEVVYVKRKLEITKPDNKYESLVVLCPECSDVFEDTYMCSEHHKLCHGGERGKYSVCSVVYRCMITLHNEPFCQSCRTQFDSHRELHFHWTQVPQHHPVTRAVPDDTLPLYICPFCDMIFVKNFYTCKTHILIHSTRKANNGKALTGMKIRYVQKSKASEEAPLTKADVEGEGALNDSIDNLKRMSKHFLKVGMSKKKRKKINLEIQELQQTKRQMLQ